MSRNTIAGDFTGLATDYSKFRPDYNASVLNGLIGLIGKPVREIDFVDIGAGTGIWTRMVASKGVNSVMAIEPNLEMRKYGKLDSRDTTIVWQGGSAADTGLGDSMCDWVTMASSFHWANFDGATAEFYRILRPKGWFTALWNPRLIEVSPLLMEIETYLDTLRPNIQRVSSGRSGITNSLTEKLLESNYFDDVVYTEGRHVIVMSTERYIGAWRSVNDLRVQLGPDGFDDFLDYVKHKIKDKTNIEATYLTRAWSARRKN